MEPILHLSIPVRDLEEARAFYVDVLGCNAARARSGFQDVWFYGLQLTLHDRPAEVAAPSEGGVRHFGVTLGRADFDALLARVTAHDVQWVAPVSTDDKGAPTEQTKAKLADPSGNVIEIKTCVDVAAALEFSPHASPHAAEHGN